MTTRNFILALTFLLSLAGVRAQEKTWTLQECVDYAALNNPDITYRQLADKQASVALREAYGAYQPTISASTAHNYGNQPYGDPEHRYTGSYGVSANWTLWNASRDDQIDLAKEQKTSATASVKEQMNAVTEKVIKAYTQILYDDESVKINEEMLRLTESQTNLAKEKFNAGQTAIADYAQMESELSNRRYSVIAARNAARSDRLNLCELMFLPLDWNLKVNSVEIAEERILAPLPTWENVFENAVRTRPEIHIASLNVEQAQTQTKVAKAYYMPSVQMGANVGTSNMEKSDTRFGEQLKDNWSNSVGVSVNVPILSGYSTKAKVAKAKIALEEAKTNAAVAEKTLRQQHKLRDGDNDDFTIRSQAELSAMMNSTSEMMTTLLACIAGISLIVGGIGIMNIEYVSVTERTKEIGLRMSVGARGIDIMAQFLIEAVIISVLGGTMGVLLGVIATILVNTIAAWPVYVEPWSVLLSFSVCVITGIFFGWYPARKASSLNPIDAIRYE